MSTVYSRVEESCARGRGRPRSATTRRAILSSAYELLAEGGLSRFTIEGVATRSGAAKTTIYRWWPSKGALAADAFLTEVGEAVPFPDTGDALADLRAHLHALADLFSGCHGPIVAALIAEGQSDPAASEAYRDRVMEMRCAGSAAMLERGMAAGQVRPGIDVDATLDALYGPLYLRLLVRRGPLDIAWVDRVLDTVLNGIRPKA